MSPVTAREHCAKGSWTPFYSFFQYTITVGLVFVLQISSMQAMKLSFPESEEVTTRSTIPACPKRTWYHNETKACWPSKQQGPCPKSMIFYPISKQYGDCDCPEVDHGTVYVYDLASDQCFRTYQQAFCANGEWLIFDTNHELTCAPNTCARFQRENPEDNENHPVVLFKNKCVRLLKPIDDENCRKPYEVGIDKYTGSPVCSSDFLTQTYDIGVKGSFKCRPGTRRDRLGKCRPTNSKVSFRPSSDSAS